MSKEYDSYKSSSGEYMIAVGALYGADEGVKRKIVFARGTIGEPIITRIVEIDADNETELSDERKRIYEIERRGIRTKAEGIFRLYTRFDVRDFATFRRNNDSITRNNNQLGTDRGAGSSGTQKAESRVRNTIAPIAQTFKDANGKNRKVRRYGSQYMVEGTKRKKRFFDTAEAAIDAENAYLESKKIKHSARKRITPEMDASYLDAVNRGDMETAQRLVDEAAKKALSDSKIRDENGKLRVVYHGTNTGDFTVFNPDYIGMSSGDDGFFGMGFYFAYSKGEAKYYGAKRIISAYLDLKNPFDFEAELQTYKGERASGGYAPDAVALMNLADKFPEMSQKLTIGVVEKGNDTVKEISFSEFSKAFKDVIENKTFEYAEVTNEYGETETLVTADPIAYEYEYNGKKHSYVDYSFHKRFWGKPNKLDVAYEYLSSSVYEYVDMIRRTRLILDNNKEFTAALKAKGYDGTIQSKLGDEAVAFYPEQIKSADPITYDDNGNVIPLSERFNSEQSDIRYSSRKKRTVTLSVGEEAKFRANYTRSKVFSKSNMYRIIEKFASKGELTAKTTEELADDMWISFNSATTVEERREFAHSTAQFVVSKLLQESKSQSKEAAAATEQLLYLKGGIRRIDFTPDEITEIRFKKDESGLLFPRAKIS